MNDDCIFNVLRTLFFEFSLRVAYFPLVLRSSCPWSITNQFALPRAPIPRITEATFPFRFKARLTRNTSKRNNRHIRFNNCNTSSSNLSNNSNNSSYSNISSNNICSNNINSSCRRVIDAVSPPIIRLLAIDPPPMRVSPTRPLALRLSVPQGNTEGGDFRIP